MFWWVTGILAGVVTLLVVGMTSSASVVSLCKVCTPSVTLLLLLRQSQKEEEAQEETGLQTNLSKPIRQVSN